MSDDSAIDVLDVLLRQVWDPQAPDYDLTRFSDAVEAVFKTLATEDISELIANLVHQGKIILPQGASILRVAVWSGTENGRTLEQSLDQWLRDSRDPILISLALDRVTYPFTDPREMRTVLSKIAQEFPQHAQRCTYLIESRPA